MPKTAQREAGPTWSVLRRRDYRLLLLSFGSSRAGDFLYLVALVVYVFDQTQSAAWVAAATLGGFVPAVALSPFAGVLADRHERRTAMVASDLAQLAAMIGLTVGAALSGPVVLVVVLSSLAAAAATVYRRRINQLAAPGYLGEIGLVERIPRTATVTTTTDATLWRIPGRLFLDAVRAGHAPSPVLAGGITTRLARNPATGR